MLLKIYIAILGMVATIQAANFYPLPSSVTQKVFVSPFYGVTHMHKLNISHDGGAIPTLKNGVGFRLKVGDPFNGFSIQYEYMAGRSVKASTDYTKTMHKMDVFRLRYDRPFIKDDFSRVVGFASIGQLLGRYEIQTVSENQGVTRQVERRLSGIIAEVGISFVYQLNPQWYLFLEPSTQVSMSESNKNLLGETQSGGTIDFTATSIRIGSTINL